MNYITNTPEETEAVGRILAEQLTPGSVVAFKGNLGAGKTAFTRGLAAGLGIKEPVISPTYTIVNEYLSGRIPLFHFDLYRLSTADDLLDIGWEDYLERGGICAVEWSENAQELMEHAVTVTITADSNEPNRRRLSIEGI